MMTLCVTSVFSVFSVVRKTLRSFLSTEVRKFVQPVVSVELRKTFLNHRGHGDTEKSQRNSAFVYDSVRNEPDLEEYRSGRCYSHVDRVGTGIMEMC
jgi:hypothetical protein